MIINAAVEAAHYLHNTVLKRRKGFKAQIVDRRLQQLHLFAPGLGGLHVFHQNVAVGNNVRLRNLSSHINTWHCLKVGPCQQTDKQQGNHQYSKTQTAMVSGAQHLDE